MSQQGYIGRNPGDGRTIVNRQTSHVTTGVQTSFTMTAGYEIGYLDVYLNGIKQTETLDYTASDGSTINFALSYPPVNGDVLEFVAFETLNITNIKSARRNFTVGQDLDVTGNVTIGSSLTVASDLVVNGTFTTINTEILDVEDKTVGIASTSSPSNTTADGAGIVIYGGSDGDKSITWNSTKSNFVIVGGGVSIGTGVTISTPANNVLAFSVNSAEKARFNNFGAFTVGYEGEAWHEGTYVGVLQAGSGAWIGQTPGASARAEWTNNAYYDSVNTRWEYIAADEANRIVLENGELKVQSADAGSADGAITWNEKLKMTVGGDFKIGAPTGIGVTISSSGNIDAIGIATVGIATISGNVTLGQTKFKLVDTGGYLHIQTNTGEDTAKFQKDGGTFLYFNNSQKLVTDSGGVSVTGRVAATSFTGSGANLTGIDTDLVSDTSPQLGGTLDVNGQYISFPDSNGTTNQTRFGTGDDLKIYHQSDSSYIINSTGNLNIGSNNEVRIKGGSDVAEHMGRFIDNGAVELYFDGVKTFATENGGIAVTDDDTTSYVKMVTSGGDAGYLHGLNNSEMSLLDREGHYFIRGTKDGATDLYYDNSIKLSTLSGGVDITGDLIIDGAAGGTLTIGGQGAHTSKIVIGDNSNSGNGNLAIKGADGTEFFRILSNGNVRFEDNEGAYFGAGSDLGIYHNGTSNYADIASGQQLYFRVGGSNKFYVQSGGAQFVGSLYGDDDNKIELGNGQDLKLFHDGSHTYLQGYNTGNMYLGTIHNGDVIVRQNSQNRFQFAAGGFNPLLSGLDLGNSSYRWRNLYTEDLQLSNKSSGGNDVDGTWGDYTIQEGESDLFLINNRSGKKYKFNLTEVS